jgi:hypothetical protein
VKSVYGINNIIIISEVTTFNFCLIKKEINTHEVDISFFVFMNLDFQA